MSNPSYYIDGLNRQANAADARAYLGIVDPTTAYGEIYIADNAATQTLTLINTFYPWTTGWVVGENYLDVPDVAGKITSGLKAVYRASIAFSASVTGLTQILEFALFRNGVYQPDHSAHFQFVLGRGNAASLNGILTLDAGDVIDFRIQNISSAGKLLTIEDANLSISAIAPV